MVGVASFMSNASISSQGSAQAWTPTDAKAFEALAQQGREAQKRLEAQRVSGTKPSLPLADYAGTYVDSMYGEARVREEGGKIVLTRGPGFVGDLEHWHFDTFRANWRARNLGRTFVSFRLGATGKPDDLAMDLGGAPTAFKRRPEMADTTAGVTLAAADVRKFIGSYQSSAPPIVLTVEEVGGRLRATIPGQPGLTMVPMTATRFKLVGPNIQPVSPHVRRRWQRVKTVTLEPPDTRPPLTPAESRVAFRGYPPHPVRANAGMTETRR